MEVEMEVEIGVSGLPDMVVTRTLKAGRVTTIRIRVVVTVNGKKTIATVPMLLFASVCQILRDDLI